MNTENTEYQEFLIERDGEFDFKINGKLIAFAETSLDVYRIYETDTKRFVCTKEVIGSSGKKKQAILCQQDDFVQIIDFFGLDSLGKRVMSQAGYETFEDLRKVDESGNRVEIK